MSACAMSRAVRPALFGIAALTAVVVTLVCGATASAHEIGTTRVSVAFAQGRTYDIVVVTDAAALVEKLGGGRSSATA